MGTCCSFSKFKDNNSSTAPCNPAAHQRPDPEHASGSVYSLQSIEAPSLSLMLLNQATDDFGSKAQIGEGSYGRVYYAIVDGRAAAIKKLDTADRHDSIEDFLSQVSTVSRLKHENITKLVGYCVEGGLRILAYEFATKGSLHDILHGQEGVHCAQPGPALTWIQRVKIAIDAAKGLEYLHEKTQPPIIHRDIRSSNVLVFEDFSAKIGDFNLSNLGPDMAARLQSSRVLGSFGYHAPEYAMTGKLTRESDVYSFGVVPLELLTGRRPVDLNMPRGQQSLVTWAVPLLCDQDTSRACVDPRLESNYPLQGFFRVPYQRDGSSDIKD
ncbi:hypothetical protein KP509_1Z057300 [Ceratopteris richardii]|nr:hypothetical protein KP509_1Z057300 [Ceratopteris richardii]KAH6558555.1 hypothetical protein KP509_1Z057300 [Ceratopteris richardii]